jgi:D-tyrosyl-tRNA(Tyr) deacylase
MKIIVQRSLESSVSVDKKIVGRIEKGVVLLVGFTPSDTEKEIDYLVKKVLNLRIFDDEDGVMNKSLLDINGEVLSISQFTLYGDAKNGNRPSYINAMKGNEATILFDLFNKKLKELVKVETGIFGAEMNVSISNDGPVTIILESEGKKDA